MINALLNTFKNSYKYLINATKGKKVVFISLGILLIATWTLYKFFTQNVNFDLVGQQVLASHWLDGHTEGSTTAPTNYLIKIILLYIPYLLLNMNPVVFLIISAILINVISFLGILYVLKKYYLTLSVILIMIYC